MNSLIHDDFGSGYSSIRCLANMPVNIVEFDIAMIQTMRESPRNAKIVEPLARMIRDAGYQLIAEGKASGIRKHLNL